ncbi:hypothetical protein [Neobacillus niacini]|uniref:hypothetical protein n=1 Tax=Neobacillus niacini TaxID=86668 RepID=UPI0021CB33A6|nr:hypothetical protein [Neobacillus niacini]MCM3768375.1 hypothetical protein [Neobacillus niacini]
MKKDKGLLEFDLLENGLDFIIFAINQLKNGGKNELKYGILHLSAGVDLVLKYRLSQEHWSLLFADINTANTDKLNSGDFKSVDSVGCIDRLKRICGIELSEKEVNQLKHLRDRRNRLEHFGITESVAALKSSTFKVLNFILNFINEHIDYSGLNETEESLLESIREQFRDFEEFIQKRLESLKPKIESHKRMTAVTICPTCYQDALVIDDGASCLFCGVSGDGEEMAGNFVFQILGISSYDTKDGTEYPIYECSECGAESLVHSRLEDEVFGWLCFTCGTEWSEQEKAYCETCGHPYSKSEYDIGMCSNCIEYRIG